MSESVEAKKESMVISWVEGVRLAAEVRNHRVLVDQPLEEGGQDQGVTPVEMFIASLGTCIGSYAVRFFQRHKIPTSGLKIGMEWSYAEQPHRIGTLTSRVYLPIKLDLAMRERLQKVMEGCTVHNSITIAPTVSIQITTPDKSKAGEADRE